MKVSKKEFDKLPLGDRLEFRQRLNQIPKYFSNIDWVALVPLMNYLILIFIVLFLVSDDSTVFLPMIKGLTLIMYVIAFCIIFNVVMAILRLRQESKLINEYFVTHAK